MNTHQTLGLFFFSIAVLGFAWLLHPRPRPRRPEAPKPPAKKTREQKLRAICPITHDGNHVRGRIHEIHREAKCRVCGRWYEL